MSDYENWEDDLCKLEGADKEKAKINKPKTYFAIKLFIIISCLISGIINPISLCWTIPISIYVFYKIAENKKINIITRVLTWVLISPIVGGMLIGYKEQTTRAESAIDVKSNKQKKQKKVGKLKRIAIIYFLASILIVLIIFKTNFSEFTRVLLGIYGCGIPWVIIICFGSDKKTVEKDKTKEKIKKEETTLDYNSVLSKNNETITINEKSLVKVEQFRRLAPNKLLSFGESWVVFSNMYLENYTSFPELNLRKWKTEEFREYYYNLVEIQKGILPKPKKYLNIAEGDLDFYYPCSEVFSAMYGKQRNDIVKICGGDILKILDIINP